MRSCAGSFRPTERVANCRNAEGTCCTELYRKRKSDTKICKRYKGIRLIKGIIGLAAVAQVERHRSWIKKWRAASEREGERGRQTDGTTSIDHHFSPADLVMKLMKTFDFQGQVASGRVRGRLINCRSELPGHFRGRVEGEGERGKAGQRA